MTKILIVDDDVQIRRALHKVLSGVGYAVIESATGREALELAAAESPGMVVLDLSMPGMSGHEVCKELRSWSKVPILILSVRDQDADKVAALDSGADDYLTKPFSTDELLARIRAHLRRASEETGAEPVLHAEGLKVDFVKRQVVVKGEEVRLTKTEFALLHYLFRNAGRVVTYDQILNHVWGAEYKGDIQTLRVHVGNLRRKIEPDPDRPRFIITDPGVGYRFITTS